MLEKIIFIILIGNLVILFLAVILIMDYLQSRTRDKAVRKFLRGRQFESFDLKYLSSKDLRALGFSNLVKEQTPSFELNPNSRTTFSTFYLLTVIEIEPNANRRYLARITKRFRRRSSFSIETELN